MYVHVYVTLQECNYSNIFPVGMALLPCMCSRAKDYALYDAERLGSGD